MNGYATTGTLFPHKDIYKATRVSPDGQTRNQIGHVLIRREFKASVVDKRAYRGVDTTS